jgi:DNA-binding winged helix-turn-helix (wHTH) protein/TolB-like protein/Tfp pilus assembly protein PilF
MTSTAGQIYEFDAFRIDTRERQLLRDGEVVPLTPKVFDTLLVLVENSGHILSKNEVIKTVWSDTIVEEASLTKNISVLRKALRETPDSHQYIETIPWRGYRFVASVREVGNSIPDLVVEEQIGPRVLIEPAQEASESGSQAKFEPVPIEKRLVAGGEAKRKTKPVKLTVQAAGAILVLAIAAVILLSITRSNKPPAVPVIRSVAVLPFQSLSAEADDQYLGLGMADTLIVKLSSINQLVVRPTSAVRKYGDVNQDPLAAGREQQVDAVLEGSIYKGDGRIRVSARLLSLKDGLSLWAGSFDEKDEDIFRLQDSMINKLAGALTVTLTGEEQQSLAKPYTENIKAYQAYLRGRYFWNKRTEEGLKKAIEYFNQAIVEDPHYTLAYGGLADCYKVLGRYGWLAPEESFPKAKEAVMKALAIDNQLAEIHASLATLIIAYDYVDRVAGERAFMRAIELNPNYPTAHQWYAEYLSPMGRHQEALTKMKRAQELDPVSPIISAGLAGVLYYARDYDQAIEQSHKTLEIDPTFVKATWVLSAAYQGKSRYEESIAVLQEALKSSPDQRECLGELGYGYAMTGRIGAAQRIIKRLQELSKRRYGSAYYIALVYTGLGEKDRALSWLEKAYDERSMGGAANTLGVEPRFDGLRSDSRFNGLVHRMGLEH